VSLSGARRALTCRVLERQVDTSQQGALRAKCRPPWEPSRTTSLSRRGLSPPAGFLTGRLQAHPYSKVAQGFTNIAGLPTMHLPPTDLGHVHSFVKSTAPTEVVV
jgi:hypothetical protein